MSQLAEVKQTLSALEGRWQSEYNEVDGRFVGPVQNVIELRGTQFKVYQNDKVTYEGTFTIGPVRGDDPAPIEIVLTYSKSANPLYMGGPRAGLFQLYGDTLKWTFGAVGHSAPKQLNTYPGSESVLSVYVKEGTKLNVAERRISAFASAAAW
jgi:hypothetical protein